jgi:hypothetical protein
MALAGLVVFLVCQWRRTDPATSAVLAVLTTLLFYRVAFVQYQMSVFVLLAFWLGRYARVVAHDRVLAVAIGVYLGWVTLFDLFVLYRNQTWVSGPDPWHSMLEMVGLPSFLIGCFLAVNLLRVGGPLEEPPRSARV